MKKWYFGAALMAGWLCQAGNASAQGVMPSPVGAARIPEPIPCGPTPKMPDLQPGPIDPLSTPKGPPDGTDLPADHSSAFQCEEFVKDDHWFTAYGSVGLMRQKLGNTTEIAYFDPSNIKSGVATPGQLQTIQNLSDISSDWNFGPKMTVGYQWENQSLEITGFWIPNYHDDTYTQAPGQLNVPFFNPPLGFEGDNGMWLHADQVVTTFKSAMWNAEINYTYTDLAVTDAQLILGIRYIDLYESLGIFTGDDDLTFPTATGPDPTRQATYQVQTHNRIIAPQIGFEWAHSLTQYFSLGVNGKAAMGVDLVETHNSLVRGDGFTGFDYKREHVVPLSQIYDVGAFVSINPLERMRIRVGYNAMFLVNVASAEDQLDFDLSVPQGHNEYHSTIFYHGPSLEFQFLF